MTVYLHDDQIPAVADPETGLPIGPELQRPGPAAKPERIVLDGRYCRLEPLDPKRHGDDLWRAVTPPDAARRFQYLPVAAPASRAEHDAWMETRAASPDPLYFTVIDKRTGRAEGRQSLMRIDPANQSIEIGDIYWGPAISRSAISTEANYLFASYAFDALGYRRYEWKCNALNAPSRRAAERFGFTYEGLFRRAVIVRGRTRDTTWFAMIDEEWPALKAAYERWLDPANFDGEGRQRTSLGALTAAALGRAS
jgi:RimJ/RimL family protein N-acetyltransferase